MVSTPEFFTRTLMVASSPGTNSLTPITLAEKDGEPPRYFVAAETGATMAALQTQRKIIASTAPVYPEKLVEVIKNPPYWDFFLR
jgi:hypothetical protein